MTPKDFLHYLITNIADNPDSVVVNEEFFDDNSIVLHLNVDQSDMGKIIGKEGRIIKSVRDLVRLMALRQNLRINVVLEEQA